MYTRIDSDYKVFQIRFILLALSWSSQNDVYEKWLDQLKSSEVHLLWSTYKAFLKVDASYFALSWSSQNDVYDNSLDLVKARNMHLLWSGYKSFSK